MAITLLLVFSPSLIPINHVFASNNGPNAPEAASFEPVDATDMVNLVTGDMSYVLPLLNVPSPEGGYPISLSYHAGIAMDQEASWVGLGWSLNPGAINRGVNGYPDDWGKTNVNEFFYDAGFSENFYNFSAGVTINNYVTVGLGASWGSNQSLGGYVSASVGIGDNASVGGTIGTNGASVHGGVSGFRASLGTNGVGLGYGFAASQGSNTGIGLNLNYNYNAGLSGGVSVSRDSGKTFDGKSRRDGGVAKTSALGVNFDSNGPSINGRVNGSGAGVSNASYGSNAGEYDVNVITSNFSLPIYLFYIGYGQTEVKYSLFKYSNLYTSGMLNPVLANTNIPYTDGSGLSRSLRENYFMDVNIMPKYDAVMNVDDLLEQTDHLTKNNLVLPNYDNYTVTAQGLSGSLKPYQHTELNLSGRGRGEQNNDEIYTQYLNHDLTEYQAPIGSGGPGSYANKDALNRVNFTMDNTYNSFLRMETSQINRDQNLSDNEIGDNTVLEHFNTAATSTYANGNYTALNLSNGLKREGNYIEVFTNEDIRNGGIPNFLEATDMDRQDTDTFLNEGIGAYRITTMDGRTYHYSLPVYNFETFYKNFKNQNNEDENFFEIQKTTPYATHWLLTAVTGPDYIDVNSDGQVDEGDYGYWVEFQYGKWSDGYVWQTPNGRYQEDMSQAGETTYSYSWGRKQIYYLDAVKTRTHTALFIKDLRSDAKSTQKEIFNNRWISGPFNDGDYFTGESHSNTFTSGKEKVFGEPGDTFYNGLNNEVVLPNNVNGTGCPVKFYAGSQQMRKYVEIPQHSILRLKKILLLRNEDANVATNAGPITPNPTGKISSNISYLAVKGYSSVGLCGSYQVVYEKEIKVDEFGINLYQNVFDVEDVKNLNLDDLAQQVISLDYDYSLAKNSPNSSATDQGRLTLKKVHSKGKQGIELIPPYSFSYYGSEVAFNKDNINNWGYNENNFQAWNLSEIGTPTGGKIKVTYERDSYYAEAATYENKYFENIDISQTGEDVEITFNDGTILSDYFRVGSEASLSFRLCVNGEDVVNTPLLVMGMNNDKLQLKIIDNTEVLTIANDSRNCNGPNQTTIADFYNLKLKNNKYPHYTDLTPNGKMGGGIRVKKLEVSGDNTVLTTEYEYTDPQTGNISGITSYAPSNEAKGVPYASELPAPTVMYGHVRLLNKDRNGTLMGSTAFEFETLQPFESLVDNIFNIGGAFEVKEQQDEIFNSGKVTANKYTIYSSLANVGRLLSVTSYNRSGQKLSEKRNSYRENLDGDSEIGVTQESHKSLKRVLTTPVNSGQQENFYVSSTSKLSYPSVLENTTSSQDGMLYTTHFDRYNFLTGQILETRILDSKGNEFKTETVPAYTIPEYVGNGYGMASKIENSTNKNMLVQEAVNKTFVKVGADWEETNVGITTWNNNWTYTNSDGSTSTPTADSEKIWRKHKSYVWNGTRNTNGTYQGFVSNTNDGFDWTVGSNIIQSNTKWRNTSTVTAYDRYSMPLEAMDINGNKFATKMGDKNTKIFAQGNAGYGELFYSGAEDLSGTHFGGEVGLGTAAPEDNLANVHTGSHALAIASGQTGYVVSVTEGKSDQYKVSLWAKHGTHTNVTLNVEGQSSIAYEQGELFRAGDWVQLNFYFTLTGTKTVSVGSTSGSVYVDDFRLHPVASSMSSYVYNPWDELTHIIGPNNLATEYRYDEMGRLEQVLTEVADFTGPGSGGFQKTQENQYTYKYQ